MIEQLTLFTTPGRTPLSDALEIERHFDAAAAKLAADKGIEIAAEQKASLVITARNVAIEIAKEQGVVTMDDVIRRLAVRGICKIKGELKNAAGAIFRDRRFEFTGQMVKSERIHAKGNLLRQWRIK